MASEKGPAPGSFSSPEDELAYLRAQIAERDLLLKERGIDSPEEALIKTELYKYRATPPQEVLAPERILVEQAVNEIVLDLAPEKDDEQIGSLLEVVHNEGIRNAFAVLDKLNSPHLEDDFHRALIQYVKEGYPVKGLTPKESIWPVVHMTLYEVSLPETKSEEEKNRSLKELISSMEQWYGGMLSLGPEEYFTIEVAVDARKEEAVFYIGVPRQRRELFEKQLLSIFPKAHIVEQTNDYNVFVDGGEAAIAIGRLQEDPLLPLKTYGEFDYDPLNVVVNAFSKLAPVGEGAAIQFVIRPAGERYLKRYRTVIGKLEKGMKLREALADTPDSVAGEVFKVFKEIASAATQSSKKESSTEAPRADSIAIEQARKKIETPIPQVIIRLVASAATEPRAQDIVSELAASFTQFDNSLGNRLSFKTVGRQGVLAAAKSFSFRVWEQAEAAPLSIRELTTLMHLPLGGMSSAPHLAQIKSGTAPAPIGLPQDGTLLGINTFRNQETSAYLTPTDRVRHLYVIGQTGTGKSVFLKNLIIQDIQQGYGGCFIDPHGSDIEDILANIPKDRYEDVVYFDPAHTERVMGLNMLEFDPTRPEQKTFVVNELFSIFRKLYSGTPEAMGPAFEQYFRNATMLVLEDPDSGSTLLDVSRVLADAKYREAKLAKATNPVVVQFWRDIATKAQGEASLANIVPYITNKFDVFTANEIMRPIIAQQKSAFDFRELMDTRKILLVNLAKGKLGDINANLIGLILVGKILMAALSRVDSHGKDLPPFYLHIDEFQNITTDSIATILSEARKYKLGLTVAHQFIAQLQENIRDAVFGNVGSMAVFRVGAEDAKVIESQFVPVFGQNDIMNIDNYNCYLRLLANGKPTKPFNIRTLPAPEGNPKQVEYLKQLSYFKYGKSRDEVEQNILERYRKPPVA
jgi:hypothetical protein